MNGKKIITPVVIILAVFAIVVYLSVKTQQIAQAKKEVQAGDRTLQLVSQFADTDIMVYVVGDCPQELLDLGNKITVVAPEQISEDTMPVKWSTVHFEEFDENGRLVNEVIPRDYPRYMVLIVNTIYDIDEEQAEVIRNCAVDNKVPTLLIGARNINMFRRTLLMYEKDYSEYDTILFTSWSGIEEGIIPEDVVPAGGRSLADEILKWAWDMVAAQDLNISYEVIEIPAPTVEIQEEIEPEHPVFIRRETDGN